MRTQPFRILSYTFFILVFFMLTCRKDRIKCLECDKCKNFREVTGMGDFRQKPFERLAPCFNPRNSNEFVYVKKEGKIHTLIKYNLLNQNEVVLVSNTKVICQPKWGSNGLIAFTAGDYQIHLVKDDGSMVKRITSDNFHLYPDWKNDSVLCVEYTFNLGVPYYYCELSLEGNIIDTIRNKTFTLGSKNNLNEMAYLLFKGDANILFSYTSTTAPLSAFENTGRNAVSGISWHPDNATVYFSTHLEGIYCINKNTRKTIQIRNGCDSRSYRFMSISADGKKIIVERVDTEYNENDGSRLEESNIYIMDIDGDNEKKIF